jgi:predicted MFS family arabinose efflux permease
MRVRAAASQFGYLLGAAAGGVALAAGGYTGLGLTFAALFVAAATPHVAALARRAPPTSAPVAEPTVADPAGC